jgi:hypothetical protein
MKSNQAKLNWTLDELGWSLRPPGDMQEWDGLTKWFLQYAASHPVAVKTDYNRRWHEAAKRAMNDA